VNDLITCPECGTGDTRKLRVTRVVIQQLGLTPTQSPTHYLEGRPRDIAPMRLHCACGADFPVPTGALADADAPRSTT